MYTIGPTTVVIRVTVVAVGVMVPISWHLLAGKPWAFNISLHSVTSPEFCSITIKLFAP